MSASILIPNMRLDKPLHEKSSKEQILMQKRLAPEDCAYHTESEKGDMKREKDFTFPNLRTLLQALRIIERETGVPAQVQLRLAHLEWIRQQRKKAKIDIRKSKRT